jgi:hypothetical protein
MEPFCRYRRARGARNPFSADFDQVAGKREQLIGRVQERYGIQRDEAERQVEEWETGL